jgi:hypothetical protein
VWHIFAHARRRAAQPGDTALAVAFALIALLGFSAPAVADTKWTQSQSVWKQMDSCTRAAHKQFPDHTAGANAKREAARLKCLRAGNLPAETTSPAERDPVDVTHR